MVCCAPAWVQASSPWDSCTPTTHRRSLPNDGWAYASLAVVQLAMWSVSSNVSCVCTALCTDDSYAHAECNMWLLAVVCVCVCGGGGWHKERT